MNKELGLTKRLTNKNVSLDNQDQIYHELVDVIGDLINALRLNPLNEHLEKTPERVASAFLEIFKGLYREPPEMTSFDSNGYDQMISRIDIPFYSICAHHFLPFFGKISVGYIPDKKMIGLSKIARTAVHFACRPQTQELLAQDIANYIDEHVKPLGCGVFIKGRHLCEEMRGILKPSKMITTALKGFFLEKEHVKAEFLRTVRLASNE